MSELPLVVFVNAAYRASTRRLDWRLETFADDLLPRVLFPYPCRH